MVGRGGTISREGVWLYQNQQQDLVIGGKMVISSGVEWPSLELVESQPICWYIDILGKKSLCSQMKIYCSAWDLSKQVDLGAVKSVFQLSEERQSV